MTQVVSGSFIGAIMYERLVSSVGAMYPKAKRKENISGAKKLARKTNKAISNSRHSIITPEHLKCTLNIGIDKAKQMLKVTTQKGI